MYAIRSYYAPFTSPEEGAKMLDEEMGIFDMIFPFDLMEIDDGPRGKYDPVPWTLAKFKQIVNRWQTATNASARTAFASSKSLNGGLQIALRAGAVMGLVVSYNFV